MEIEEAYYTHLLFTSHLKNRVIRNHKHTCVTTEVPASVITLEPRHSQHVSSRHGCALQKTTMS